jgi:uncharacterized protein (TIRG00374 family)
MRAAKIGFLGFSLAILIFLVIYANPSRFVQIMRGADIAMIVAGIAVATVSISLRTVKWWLLLPQVKARTLLPIQLLGMTISNFTPGKFAEPAKTVILKLRTGVDVSLSLPSIVWERVIDVLVIIILSAFALAMLPFEGNLLTLGLLGAAAFTALALVALAVLYSRKFGTWLFRFARKFPFLSRISDNFISTFYGTRFSKGRIAGSFAVTFLAWVLDGIAIWLGMKAIGISIGLAATPGILALSTAIGIASLLPGGIGGTEAVMAIILGAVGIEPSLAITGAILARFMTFWYNQLLGGLSLVYLSRSLDVSSAMKSLLK